MKISINVRNEVGRGSFEIEIVKIDNFELEDGILVKLNDLESTKCGDYYEDIPYNGIYEGSMDNLNDLTDFEKWEEKMNISTSRKISTANGTMDGFLNIETSGEYTFYLQTGDEMNARVYIDDEEILSNWGECKPWSDIPLTKKVQLEAGYRRVIIEYMGGEGLDFHFVFDYSIPDSNERKTIPFKYYKSSFDPVMYLSTNDVEVSWLYNAYSVTALHTGKGKAESCWISNDVELPEGSEITVEGIKGKPQIEMKEKEYKLKCKNGDSETNEISIRLRVAKKIMEGVKSFYYKPNNFDSNLNTKYGPSVEGIDASYIQIQNEPFIKVSQEIPHPEGLSIEFVNDYGVYWEGYINGNNQDIGLNNFRVIGNGGYWIYINDKEVLSKPGRNEIENPSYFDYELSDEYYLVQIYYVTHNGYAFFELSKKLVTQSEEEYNRMVPFHYVPINDYFLMTQSKAIYLKGQIVNNNAIAVESFDCKDVKVVPELPNGLEAHCSYSVDNPVIIAGSATSDKIVELTEYNITVTSSLDKSVSTMINIEIKPTESPDNFYVLDLQSGKKYSDEISLVIGEFYDLQYHVESGYVISFETVNVPMGFRYNWETSTLSGSAREVLDIEIRINAIVGTSSGDIKEFTFKMKANGGCEEDNMHVFHFSNDFVDNGQYLTFSVTDSNGTKVVDIYEKETITLPRSYSLCLPIDDYTILTCGSFNYYFTIYNDGIRIYRYYADYPNSQSHTFTFNTEPVLPQFEYNTKNITIYQYNQVLLIPKIEAFIEYFSITPSSLPSGIEFNNMTGRIYGTADALTHSTNYKITAYNDKGEVNVDMIMQIIPDTEEDDCDNEGKILIGLTLYVGKYNDRVGYKLINNINQVLIDVPEGSYETNSINKMKMCTNKGKYILKLFDKSKHGWDDSNIAISAGSSVIGTYTVYSDDEGEVIIEKDYSYSMDINSEWQYSQEYTPNWEFKNTSIEWPSSAIKTLPKPQPSNPTYYLRYILTLLDYDKYVECLIRIKHKSGVIVRINGREIFRDNLPSGDVGPNTPGDTGYERAKEENFILPFDDFNETSIISYEIHKSPNDDNFPNEDRFFLLILEGDNEEGCITLTHFGGRVIDSSSKSYGKDSKSTADAAFDLSHESWIDYYGGVDGHSYADYSFGENNHYSFNQFTILTKADEESHYPKKLSLTGITYTRKIDIGSLDPIEYFKLNRELSRRATFNVDPNTLYKSIRIDIPESNQFDPLDKQMEITEIRYNLCRVKKCIGEEYYNIPDSISNTIIKTKCIHSDVVGERYLYCSNFGLYLEINTTCEESPLFIDTETYVDLFVGKYYDNVVFFQVVGNPTRFTYSCDICPKNEFIPGLIFNKTTGLISGIAFESAWYKIQFNAYNDGGAANTLVTVVVRESEYMYIYKSITEIHAELNQEINEQLFWVKSYSHYDFSVDVLPRGLSLNTSTSVVYGTVLSLGNITSLFTVKNTNGEEISMTVVFNISLPENPVMVDSVDKLELIYMMDYKDQFPVVCYSKSLTYSIDKDLPSNLTYDKITGAMSGKVTAPIHPPVNYTFSCSGINETISKIIPVSIVEGDTPFIISQNESVSLTTGQELFNSQFFVVSGSDLIYSITPSLPQGITMDSKTGTFNGYTRMSIANRTYIINVSNGKVSIQLKMWIEVKKSEIPVIPPSSIKHNVSITTGTLISIQLFDVIGDDLTVSIIPSLPEGFSISVSGYLQGISVIDAEEEEYNVTITDINGYSVNVKIVLSFIALKCPSNSGFPETLVGDKSIIKCGGGRSGFITRRCVYADGNAIWQSPIDKCSGSIVGPLIGIVIGCIIGGGVLFLGGYCIFVRIGGGRKHVRRSAEQIIDISKESGGVRL